MLIKSLVKDDLNYKLRLWKLICLSNWNPIRVILIKTIETRDNRIHLKKINNKLFLLHTQENDTKPVLFLGFKLFRIKREIKEYNYAISDSNYRKKNLLNSNFRVLETIYLLLRDENTR